MRTRLIIGVGVGALVGGVVAGCVGGAESSSYPPGGDPSTGGIDMAADWVELPAPPLSGRMQSAFVSVPDGALILGGSDDMSCPPGADCFVEPEPLLTDGARYHAADQSWTPIADSPVGLAVFVGHAVVDQRVFFWVPADGEQVVEGGDLIAYDLENDEWADVELPPLEPDSQISLTSVDGRLLVGQMSDIEDRGGDWLLDPATGQWAAVAVDPLGPSAGRSFVAGEEGLYLFETGSGDDDVSRSLVRGAVLPAGRTDWRRIADSEQLDPPTGSVAGVLIRPRIEQAPVRAADGSEVSYPYGGIYDPARDVWRALPATPPGEMAFDADVFASGVIAADDQLIDDYRHWMLAWETGTWHMMPELDPLRGGGDRVVIIGAAAGWAGDGVLVSGGIAWDGSDARFLDDAWIWRPRTNEAT